MEPVLGAAEIAELLGVSRQRVQQLTGKPGFPEPFAHLSMGKVWRTSDVLAWAVTTGRLVPDDVDDNDH